MARRPATRRPRRSPGAARPRHTLPRGPLVAAAKAAWDEALALGEAARLPQRAGLGDRADRHDRPGDGCDTTGIEPDFALVKFNKLAGGGYFKIINRAGARWRSRTPGLRRERASPRSSPMPSATARSAGARRSTTTTLRAQGLRPTRRSSLVEKSLADRLRTSGSPSHAGRWVKRSAATSLGSRRRRRPPIPSSTCWRASASPSAISRLPTCTPAGR